MIPADIVKRLKSRKFWMAVAVGVIVVFGEELGLDLTTEQVWQLVGASGLWTTIQGIIDYKNGSP